MKALVLAGGGMRGAYTSGALHAMAEMGLEFDAVYGTSAGGGNAAWFTARQTDVAIETWRWAQDPKVLNYRRWVTRRGPLLDLDHLIYELYPNTFGIDQKRIRQSHHPVWVTAADVDTGRTRFFDLRRIDVLRGIRATSALPLASQGTVEIDGRRYLDGGLTSPLPVARAIHDGADEIVVVVNKPGSERRAEPAVMSWAFGRTYPGLYTAAREHHNVINDALALARNPPAGVDLTFIEPSEDHGVHRLTRDWQLLQNAVRLGIRDTHAALT